MRPLLLAMLLVLATVRPVAADAPMPVNEILMRVRAEVAELIGKKPAEVDVARSLASQGADELDIVEIVMTLEEEFDVSIPDDAIESGGAWNTVSVQRLAQIVQKLKRSAQPEL